MSEQVRDAMRGVSVIYAVGAVATLTEGVWFWWWQGSVTCLVLGLVYFSVFAGMAHWLRQS